MSPGTPSRLSILLVQDDPREVQDLREQIEAAVAPAPHITWVANLGDGLDSLREDRYDVVFLDLGLQGSDGLSTYLELAALAPQAAIIVLGETHDEELALQILQRGAQDCLRKGQLDGPGLYRAIRFAIERQRVQAELLRASQQAKHLATHDGLTGLPNRQLCLDRFRQSIARAHRGQHKVALLYLDLDHFKPINDAYGHAVGDHVLRTVAQRLLSCVRESDTCARLGGDEFAIVLGEIRTSRDLGEVTHRLQQALAEPVMWDGQSLPASASIGISMYPWDGLCPEELVQRADLAMYRAKRLGGNTCCAFSSELDRTPGVLLPLATSIGQALERGELFLEYQPQVSCKSGAIIAVEALVRWQHPRLGRVGPTEFVAEAERAGLMANLTQWVLTTAGAQIEEWRRASAALPRLTVNVSPCQIHQRSLVQMVEKFLREHQLPGECLGLEITDGSDVQDWSRARENVDALKALGVHISIDAFGCGYAPLSFLAQLPVDALEIERRFVRDLVGSPEHAAIVRSLIQMAHTIGKVVVAEGVEDAAQLERLKLLGCDAVQGYHLHPPTSGDALTSVLRAQRALAA